MGQIALTQTIILGPEQINDFYRLGETPLIKAAPGEALIFQSAICSLIGGNGTPYYTNGDFYFTIATATVQYTAPVSNKISAANMFNSGDPIISPTAPPIISQFFCANPYPFSITDSNGVFLAPYVDGGAGPSPSKAQGQLSIYVTYSILTI